MLNIILSTDCVKFPVTGIGRYTLELSKALVELLPSDRLLCYDGTGVRSIQQWMASSKENPLNERVMVRSLKSAAKKSLLINQLYFWLKGRKLHNALLEYKDCIFHSTNFICPSFVGPKVVTIHDMSAFLCSESQEKQRGKLLRKQCEDSIHRADAIITDSYSAQHEIASYFSLPLAKIFVTYMACDKGFQPRREQEVASVLHKYGLKYKRFSLFVGTIEPRKNLGTLIEAYGNLPEKIRTLYPLVVVGSYGWKNRHIIEKLSQARRDGWLIYLNYVSDIDLKFLYSSARLFCFPTLYEGFGIPILEAMASGVPIIASNNSSIPEVAGKAGRLINAEDVTLWTSNIRELLDDAKLTEEMVNAGLNQASKFTWEKCAIETIKVYQSVSR